MRKKLASALADVKSDEVEDEYEEINVDAFIFSEVSTVISIKSSLFFLSNHVGVGNKKLESITKARINMLDVQKKKKHFIFIADLKVFVLD